MLIHFPNSLTEEEECLKQAFARLKRKKKAVQALKASSLSQEKETTHSKSATKQAPSSSIDSADKATEQAKKLVQSGAIKVVSVKEKSGFKRSKTQERKKDTERPAAGMGFQPFMSYSGEEEEQQPPPKRVKGLGESFVSAGYNNRNFDRAERGNLDRPERGNDERPDKVNDDHADKGNDNQPERGSNDRPERGSNDRPERGNFNRPERRNFNRSDRPDRRNYDDCPDRESYDRREHREPPKKGNTIYVHGVGVNEDMLTKSFSAYGKIINISLETERNKAFVTYEKTESADQAIAAVNGSMVNNTQLRVSLARHQPSFDALNDQTSTASWASIAASNSQKGNTHREKRGVVQYDHDDLF